MPKPLTNLDLDLLRAFAMVSQLGSFTRAGERLSRQQSTISLQIARLEQAVGSLLIERSPRSVRLTSQGRDFLDCAQKMLDLNDAAVARLSEPQMSGLVRLGTPEDFATRHLPDVLSRFAQAYPSVALEVTCDLTLNLLPRFRQGDFDLVLVKQEPAAKSRGTRVWREPLVWVGGSRDFLGTDAQVPLVVSPAPCVYAKRATTALAKAKVPWRIAYTCGSLTGAIAAVKAGLGLAVLPKDMVPPGLLVMNNPRLPDLPDTEIALWAAKTLSAPAKRLQQHIIRSLE